MLYLNMQSAKNQTTEEKVISNLISVRDSSKRNRRDRSGGRRREYDARKREREWGEGEESESRSKEMELVGAMINFII